MARLTHTPTGGGPVGPFESTVLETLLRELPEAYSVAPNFQLKQRDRHAFEYDFIVLAPHALYVVEAKEWYGRLTGDDTEWLLNQTPKKCPLWLVNTKCKVLRTELGAVGSQLEVKPVLVIPDGTVNHLGGRWGSEVRSLTGLVAYLQDRTRVERPADVITYHKDIKTILQGKWGQRQRSKPTRFGGYEIVETLHCNVEDRTAEYVGRRWMIAGDTSRYRIRTWQLNPALTGEARDQQRTVVQRPTEAVSKIGPHPNLLRVMQFEFIEDDNTFFEITEWSEYGTLYGFLNNKDRDRLTVRERLEVAEGVACALEAVHAADIVHRNVCPETILVGFDRKPRLTDFDRAYVEGKHTVFRDTATAQVNEAYLAPELSDVSDYDFDATSDMYSFGVLLYQLLTDRTPFKDAKEARKKGGVPNSLPSDKREGLDSKIDALILQLLRVDDFKARPSAKQAAETLRAVLGMTTGLPPSVGPVTPPPQPERLEIHSLLRGTMRIDAELGQGGFSRVFKVYNLDHQRHYALKVLLDVGNADLLIREFAKVAPLLPKNHPHIAQIIWMDRLDPPDRLPCLLTELIEGETLEKYCVGTKTLAWSDIHRIGLELLDTLVAIHPDPERYEELRCQGEVEWVDLQLAMERAHTGVFHRDIKPANIMLAMPDHRSVMIDFNIASLADDRDTKGHTRKYAPPDREDCGGASHDLFSLGVVLHELVLQRYPFPGEDPTSGPPFEPQDISTTRLATDLCAFLHRAVQPASVDRFSSAKAMRAAWSRIAAMYAPAEEPPLDTTAAFPGITLAPDERTRQDYNPYVTRLLTLYSQARRSNSGTRGLDEIARLTYVKTRLDERLAPAIVSGKFRLVIITGNAGDGKTAFLQQAEALFRENGAQLEELPTKNGARWVFDGLGYQTNYDGSQDEGDRENDEVLEQFFDPFAGEELTLDVAEEARLIAINEGRLLDFLTHGQAAQRFGGLKRFVLAAFDTGRQPSGGLLVNLNLRAVTAGGTDSLLEKQLVKMLQPALWKPCEKCNHRKRCPILHNMASLGDPSSGAAVRERARRLFEIVHLRRRAHVTMRDLRSALSYLLLRDADCDDVARLLSRDDDGATAELAELHYPNAFAAPEAVDLAAPLVEGTVREEQGVDRLVRRLREADVGLVTDPILDRRLDRDPERAVPWMTFTDRPSMALEVLRALTKNVPAVGEDVALPVLMAERRRLLAMWRRWAYFERRDDGWQGMLPYDATSLLEDVVSPPSPERGTVAAEILRDRVIDAISLSEGVRSEAIRARYLALRITRIKEAPTRSYRLFPKSAFCVEIASVPGLADYLEYTPDAVELVATDRSAQARLRVSLDLLEMLTLIGRGYRPTGVDLQGLFVNLLIFRNELLTSSFSEVLVTADDREFFKIAAAAGSDGIHLSLVKVDDLTSGQTQGGAP